MSIGKNKHIINQDVLVLGAGLADLSAAIEASDKGAKVTIIDKLPPMVEKRREDLYKPGIITNDAGATSGLPIALVFGRMAGENAAAAVKEKP
ncbi:MAG: FAD-binding protein [Dehalococcoidia bacterium]|nr:FAD-binding protein [Dehalococcoidia bacterium]